MLKRIPGNKNLDEVVVNTIMLSGIPREAIYKGIQSKSQYYNFATYDYITSSKLSPSDFKDTFALYICLTREKPYIHNIDVNIFGDSTYQKTLKIVDMVESQESLIYMWSRNTVYCEADETIAIKADKKLNRSLLKLAFITYEGLRDLNSIKDSSLNLPTPC